MPNSFANDGAGGAGDNLGANSGQPGFGSQPGSFGTPSSSFGGTPPTTGSGAITAAQAQSEFGGGILNNGALNGLGGVNQSPTYAPPGSQAANYMASNYPGVAFADGGAVDTDIGSGDTDGSPGQDAISKALESVDQVLAYGRKQYGLGGDDNGSDGAIPGAAQQQPPQQMAAGYGNGRMPAVPGSQSNSGVPPMQPQPGPLPPTSNPFGKRADAGQDADGDDDGPAIDTQETA